MIDTSALPAVLQRDSPACMRCLQAANGLLISAGTLAEALLVAKRRGLTEAIDYLLMGLDLDIIAVDEAKARRVAQAHPQWGRDRHRANLNFGDCFAYAVAKRYDCPFLFFGNDFGRTDITPAIQP